MPMPRSSKPAVCVSNERSVTGFGNVAGILNVVRYVLTSSSSCSLPCSYSCITAVAVNSFDTDAI